MLKSIFFASGPSKKFPEWNCEIFNSKYLNRTHIYDFKNYAKECLDMAREILKIPVDYEIFFTPGSGSGALYCSFLNCLNPGSLMQIAVSGFFSNEWGSELKNQFKIPTKFIEYDQNFDKNNLDKMQDYFLVATDTTNGMRNLEISDNMQGLVFMDAVSAAFLEDIPWNKVDCAACSAQKILGGDGSLGILILSPKSLERLSIEKPWPIPRMFNINKWQIKELAAGRAMSTPSILGIVELWHILNWVKKNGGLEFMQKRSAENWQVVENFMQQYTQFDYLIKDRKKQGMALACIEMKTWPGDDAVSYMKHIANMAKKLEVYDIENFANASWRFWIGPTQDQEDIKEGLERFVSLFE